MQNEQRRFSKDVQSAGGSVPWLKRCAPNLLPLLPEGLSESSLLAETRAFWFSGSTRVAECGRCPTYGGACADSELAIKPGLVVRGAVDGVELGACEKWKNYLARERLIASNVPAKYADSRVHISSFRRVETIQQYLAEARSPGFARWLLVTGTAPGITARLLVSLLEEVINMRKLSCWYDWCPRVALLLKRSFDRPDEEDPRVRISSAGFLALDFVDPRRWERWFTEALDGALYERGSKPTVLGTPLGLAELSEAFEMTGMLLDPSQVLVVDVRELR